MYTIEQFTAAVDRTRRELEALDAKNAELTKFHTDAIAVLEKQIASLYEMKEQHRQGIDALVEPTKQTRQVLVSRHRLYVEAVKHITEEAQKAEARRALLTFEQNSPAGFYDVLTFIGRRRSRWSSSDVKSRWVKHPTHKVMAVSVEDEYFRFYLAYNQAGKLASALIASGGGHRGAYVSVSVWGCKERVASRARYENKTVDGKEVTVTTPWHLPPQGFREWIDSERFAFSDVELPASDVEDLFERLRIDEQPLDDNSYPELKENV